MYPLPLVARHPYGQQPHQVSTRVQVLVAVAPLGVVVVFGRSLALRQFVTVWGSTSSSAATWRVCNHGLGRARGYQQPAGGALHSAQAGWLIADAAAARATGLRDRLAGTAGLIGW